MIDAVSARFEGDHRLLKAIMAWVFFTVVAFFGLMYLGRYVLASYPWERATDIGVSFEDGGLQFRIVPFIPLAETAVLLLAFWAYVLAVLWLWAQAVRHANPFSVRRSSGDQ